MYSNPIQQSLDKLEDVKKKVIIHNHTQKCFGIKKVIFNVPATIVLWEDGTKTVVKCGDYDVFDPEKGLAMAIAKKALGNKYNYYDIFEEWILEETAPENTFVDQIVEMSNAIKEKFIQAGLV